MPSMKPIAHIRTDFPQKFGIPRQSGLVPQLKGRIVFEPEYAREEAVRGLENFSHIWLIWSFEDVERLDENGQPRPWQPMVRPPLLGGNKQMGVFATRSPFRPNALGLSSVALERIELTEAGPILHVCGADLRDMTPIFDIKPYLPASDSHPDATGGFTESTPWTQLSVRCDDALAAHIPTHLREALFAVLAEDPRPARQRTTEGKPYRLSFGGLDVGFTVSEGTVVITDIR